MTELAPLLLRVLLWTLPGILGFLAVRAWFNQRYRVGLGLAIGGLVIALLVKPILLGILVLMLGGLVGSIRR